MTFTTDFDQVSKWLAPRAECTIPSEKAAAIGWVGDRDITAGVMYEDYTGSSVRATIAVDPPGSLTKGFVHAMFRYPFIDLGVNKIIACVEKENHKSLQLLDRLGFIEEAIVTDVYPSGDMVILTMVRSECAWLENDYGQKE